LIFGIFCLLLFLAGSALSQNKLRKIVIDAGHGGKDPGAVGAHSYEKDIALSIALQTGKYIEDNLSDVEVIYTRKTDRFVKLHERAQIANDAKADFFISIHCNANNVKSVYGTETYVMGLHKSQANLEVAKLENAAILKEEDYDDMYEGFDPNNDEDYITLTFFQNAYLDQSIDLASKVQKQFKERVNLRDRGVLQAGFWVLFKTAMPGILIETGYLSNAKDEAFLRSKKGQTYLASAIYRAVKEYKQQLEHEAARAPAPEVAYKDNPDKSPPNIVFKVQFASSKNRKSKTKFRGISEMEEYYHNGYYKYTTGNTRSFDEAEELRIRLRKSKAYRDAFVVSFLDGERIPIDDAKALLGLQ
jgi:N-acetylmuramoyl-L-alanine amidase